MATQRAVHHPARSTLAPHSRYGRAWSTVALCAASVFVAIAVLQSPSLPLLGLVLPLAAYGGILFVRSSAFSSQGRREYVAGALRVGGAVLVTVGAGHQVEAGLTVGALLAGTSPAVLRWIAGG
jgi:hypothetical protein